MVEVGGYLPQVADVMNNFYINIASHIGADMNSPNFTGNCIDTYVNESVKAFVECYHRPIFHQLKEVQTVLLKHEICWDYEDLASLRLNSHVDKTKSKIDQSAKEKLKEWLKTSYLFYDHFKVRLIIC